MEEETKEKEEEGTAVKVAFNLLVQAAREYKGTAAEHEKLNGARVLLKQFIENHLK